MKILATSALLASIVFSIHAYAWNLNAMPVNALSFKKDGIIEFTLFENESENREFKCNTGSRGQWFTIARCVSNDATCLNSVSRMSSILLAAKMAKKRVHVEHASCNVTEVALKP